MQSVLRAGLLLGVCMSTGCQGNLPQCGDAEAVSLALQIYDREREKPQMAPDFASRYNALAARNVTLENIVARQRATFEQPLAMCEASIQIDRYDVDRDPSQEPSYVGRSIPDRQAALNAYQRNPDNLIRGEHVRQSLPVSYTVAFTDDGRTYVELSMR